jgi:hypothetical protein
MNFYLFRKRVNPSHLLGREEEFSSEASEIDSSGVV